jgi:hypothetical protein
MIKPTPTQKKRSETASIIAQAYGVTPRYVRMVAEGKRNNEAIFSAYMQFNEAKNNLLKAVEELVPFNN